MEEIAEGTEPIGERAEAIRDQYDERQVTTEEAPQQLELLANEAIEAEKAKKETGLDDATFPIYWGLKRQSPPFDGPREGRSL